MNDNQHAFDCISKTTLPDQPHHRLDLTKPNPILVNEDHPSEMTPYLTCSKIVDASKVDEQYFEEIV